MGVRIPLAPPPVKVTGARKENTLEKIQGSFQVESVQQQGDSTRITLSASTSELQKNSGSGDYSQLEGQQVKASIEQQG